MRIPHPRRRSVVAAALALAGLTACTSGGSTPHRVTGTAAPGADLAATRPASTLNTAESVVQIVAHPDDDLYFMNPDLSHTLVSRKPVTTIYLTSGESDGVNGPKGTKPDRPKFAEARQNGIRAAYAKMATGNRAAHWRREAITTAGGAQAELDTLDGAQGVHLVWLQLREARSVSKKQPLSLRALWDGETPALESMLAEGSPVTRPFSYTKDQLTDTLVSLLERFKPTYVRLQDPTPDHNPKGYEDHQDHMYGARFAQRALARYAERSPAAGRPPVLTQMYVGYFNNKLPFSLSPGARKIKLDALNVYGWTDDYDCRDAAGCGDRKVGKNPMAYNWVQSTRYHRGESTSWVQAQQDGSLRAFGVLGGRLGVWKENGRGTGDWSGPQLLPGAGIDDGASAVRLADGRLAVVATRTVIGPGPTDYRRELVTTRQTAPNGDFGPWESLGDPHGGDQVRTWELGAPRAAVDGSGRLMVFLRNGSHGLSARYQAPGGTWEPWTDLRGTDLLGDLAAVTDSEGRVHVFAATRRTVLAWSQNRPRGPMDPVRPTGLPTTTGPLTARADGDEVRLFFRKPGTAEVLTMRNRPDRPWQGIPVELGGKAGFGPVTAAAGKDFTVLAGRDDYGMVSAAQIPAGSEASTDWSPSGFLFAGAPAAVPYGSGQAAVAVIGLDGRLYWTRATAGQSVGGWAPAAKARRAAATEQQDRTS
ncbi:PIG-L family deacetylase [Streptomyces sp. URMC 123]|uniref:PIG-L family deacetylase n=1 Tax=Streptomyces sp. URMC 123 TaxID=3423403 RepID=UPI003F1A892E